MKYFSLILTIIFSILAVYFVFIYNLKPYLTIIMLVAVAIILLERILFFRKDYQKGKNPE